MRGGKSYRLLRILLALGVVLFALRLFGSSSVDKIEELLFIFLFIPLALAWCYLSYREAKNSGIIYFPIGRVVKRPDDSMLFTLYLGSYWCAAAAFIFYELCVVIGVVRL